MIDRTSNARYEPAWVRTVAWIGAIFYTVTGPWAMASPGTFHDIVAPFDPLNIHYLRDAGAFSIGLAAALLLALVVDRRALPVALLAVGVGSIAHELSHIIDHAAGGRPILDIPSLAILGAALLAAGWSQRRRDRFHGTPMAARDLASQPD